MSNPPHKPRRLHFADYAPLRSDLQRYLIPEPGKVEPYPEWTVPHPILPNGVKVQVNAYHDEHGNVLERWMLSESDVRWYRLERWVNRWITVQVAQKKVVS
jgi:hypothetical protein